MNNGLDLMATDAIGGGDTLMFTTPMSNVSTMNQNLQTLLAGFHIEWELPVALILVSLAW